MRRFVLATLIIVGLLALSSPSLSPKAMAVPASSVQFLTLPFPGEVGMNVQQGWLYTDRSPHHGIDYINGGPGSSSTTWQHFPILAAADGEACGDRDGSAGGCVAGLGNRILIKHTLPNGATLYTYYGHLNWIGSWIPLGNRNNTVHVTRGSEIATAGDTGAPGLVHLHFGLTPPDFSWLDPYGLQQTRPSYPNPNGTNGLRSGPNHYWTANPPAYAPGLRVNLGGVDIVRYCRSIGNQGASLDGRTAWDWHCVTRSGAHIGLNMTSACRWQYSRNNVSALWRDFYDSGSWRCYTG